MLEKRCSSTSRGGQDSSGEKAGLQNIYFEKKFGYTRGRKVKIWASNHFSLFPINVSNLHLILI